MLLVKILLHHLIRKSNFPKGKGRIIDGNTFYCVLAIFMRSIFAKIEFFSAVLISLKSEILVIWQHLG